MHDSQVPKNHSNITCLVTFTMNIYILYPFFCLPGGSWVLNLHDYSITLENERLEAKHHPIQKEKHLPNLHVGVQMFIFNGYTFPETNITPENGWLEEEFWEDLFSGAMSC